MKTKNLLLVFLYLSMNVTAQLLGFMPTSVLHIGYHQHENYINIQNA